MARREGAWIEREGKVEGEKMVNMGDRSGRDWGFFEIYTSFSSFYLSIINGHKKAKVDKQNLHITNKSAYVHRGKYGGRHLRTGETNKQTKY